MANKELTVSFPSKISTSENCVCTACHHLGRVIKLEMPETLYRGKKGLTAEYNSYWLCFNCREKLMNALMWGDEDGN